MTSLAQVPPDLHIDGNVSETAAVGTTSTWRNVVAGFNSGTVNGVLGGTYIVPTGASVMLSGLFAGFAPNSTGLVTVNGGSISTDNPQSQYYIGFNGSGELDVSNGGHVFSASQSYVGYNGGSSGVLTVDGQGSTYTNAGFFVVANGGTGQLSVTNGGVVSTTTGTLQIGGGATATALVSGTGSRVSAGSYLGVGVGSSGNVLTITNGGTATSGSGTYLAFNPGSGGTIAVSNGGSLTSPLLVVGFSGAGDLQVQQHGAVTISGRTIIGADAATSSVEVGGAGAVLTVQNNNLIVGGQGNGALTISNQGTVTVTGTGGTSIGGQCSGLPAFCPTPLQGGSGAVTVSGAGSVLNAGTTLAIGQFGAGTLIVANGGEVLADAVTIAQNAGSVGTVDIGAPAGQTPIPPPGTLDPPTLVFGSGDGRIVFNHTDMSGNYVFDPVITGTGAVDVYSGNTVMSASSNYAGPTTIYGGVLSAGIANAFSPNASYAVQAAGTLNLNGFNQTVASLSNAGLVNMGSGTSPGTRLTTNSYLGQRGTISLNTYLGDDNSPSDRLVIDGGTATGQTYLRIVRAGGPGAATLGNGILVVDTLNGGSTDDEAFALSQRVVEGPYEYLLARGSRNPGNAQAWYLRSGRSTVVPPLDPGTEEPEVVPQGPEVGPQEPEEGPGEPEVGTEEPGVVPQGPEVPLYRPEVAAYLADQRQAGEMFVHSLHDRAGEPLWIETQGASPGDPSNSAWLRVVGRTTDSTSRDGNFAVDTDSTLIQGGGDLTRWDVGGESGRLHLGIMVGYGSARSDTVSAGDPARARGDIHGWSVGAYGTWYQDDKDKLGWYVDTWGTYGWFRNTVEGDTLPDVRYDSHALNLSGETGYALRIRQGSDWMLEPQAQLIYVNYGQDDVDEVNGTHVSGSDGSGWISRLGLRTYHNWVTDDGQRLQPYLTLNWWHDSVDNALAFNQVVLKDLYPKDRYEAKAGINLQLSHGWSAWTNLGYQWGNQNYRATIVRLGAKYAW
ncbi:autotransporter outer membrane beta-barrel domain-containing protein [Dyella halodurans]|nr:autotransporter outer membrane beta-barrel domain-containing protein [Dyella halodurans]